MMISFLNISIEPLEIIDFLKQQMLLKEICQNIVHQKIIEKASTEREIVITPEEIQTEADSIRYGHRLEKAADTLAWLKDQMITMEEWEAGIKNHLLEKKLAKNLFDKDVEPYFAQNKLDFDQLVFYQIIVPYQRLAQEIYYQIEEEEISFYEAAHLYDMDEQRRYHCGYEGKIGRWSLPAYLAEAIGNANIGQVVGPIPSQDQKQYHLLMVQDFIPAELTSERHEYIINRLFQEWLEGEFNSIVHNQ